MYAQPTAPAAFCFARANPEPHGLPALPLRLADRPAEALARLVPLLGCGEEAAALAFDGLAGALDAQAPALRLIAEEERVHGLLLHRLSASLPAVEPAQSILRGARRFHVSLGRGGPLHHLARIAAIDAAVCTILSRLLRPGAPIASDPSISIMFARIRRDEARHVHLSRRLAKQGLPGRELRELGAAARAAMAVMLAEGAGAFETLEVDSAKLLRDIARLPARLYA